MKLITGEVIVDLVKRRFKPIDSNWESDAADIIGEGISSINIPMGYEVAWELLDIKNNRTRVPQEAEELLFVMYEGSLLNKSLKRTALNPEKIDTKKNTNVDALMEIESLTLRHETLQTLINNTTDIDKALEYQEKQQEVLEEILVQSKVLQDRPLPTNSYPAASWQEQGHYIVTSFETGQILVYYKKYFLSDEGYPMIIDTQKYRTAMYFYFVWELLSQGYESATMRAMDAFEMHEMWAQKARNEASTFGIDEHEAFARATVRMKFNPNLGKSNFTGV